MELKPIFVDEDAVSPVIGVILMVAITVILAAVIGTFVLGLGDQVQSTSPTASFTFDFTDEGTSTNDELAVTHDGGDSLDAGNIQFAGDDNLQVDTNADGTFGGDAQKIDATADSFVAGDSISAGTTVIIQNGSSAADRELDDETLRVVWSSSSDSSATLGRWDGPNA